KKWREELKVEWPLIKEAFLRGKISGKWEKYGFVYVDLTMYQWYGDAIYSLDDLRLFEERERERLKKKPLDRRATPHKDNNQKTFRVRKNAAVEGDCRIFDFYRSSFVQIWVDHSISTPHPAPA
ncbi:MAG: hypothetical protein J6O13_16200, partial [Selenomonas sp.]|nr:hypothetical protein [Selenomonas sp.]